MATIGTSLLQRVENVLEQPQLFIGCNHVLYEEQPPARLQDPLDFSQSFLDIWYRAKHLPAQGTSRIKEEQLNCLSSASAGAGTWCCAFRPSRNMLSQG